MYSGVHVAMLPSAHVLRRVLRLVCTWLVGYVVPRRCLSTELVSTLSLPCVRATVARVVWALMF